MSGRFVLAIDIERLTKNELEDCFGSIQALFGNLPYELEPVSVLLNDKGLSHEELEAKRKQRQIRLFEMLRDLNDPHAGLGKVISRNDFESENAVRILVQHALRTRTDAFITYTRSHGDFSRFILGSFSKALVEDSPIPVIVLPPKGLRRPGKFRILFPTDFSENSWMVLERLIEQWKAANPEVLIHHHRRGAPEDAATIDDLKVWTKRLKGLTLKTAFKVTTGNQSVSEAVLEEARKNQPHLIALATDTNPLHREKEGSISEAIVSSGEFTAWLLQSAFRIYGYPVKAVSSA